MSAAKGLVAVAGIIMAVALVYGFTAGNGWTEVRELTAYPWFNVSLVDVYVGFALVSGWIVHRERRPLVAAAWIVAICLLGNLITCLYVLLTLHRSGDDRTRFWHGGPARG